MAAATVTLSSATSMTQLLSQFQRRRRGFNVPNSNPDFMAIPFDSGSFTPAATSTDDADDEIRVLYFPKGFKLVDFQIVSTADVDTGAAALVYDVIADDGTTETVLLSGCQVGRTASDEDEMDRNLGNMLLDVGGKYLALKITTPANANAGTGALRVKGWGFMGALANPTSR